VQNKVLILDFGSQYSQVITRRVRELNIYCDIYPFDKQKIDYEQYGAIILSGSPHSVRQDGCPKVNLTPIKGKKPILGVCYGAQLMATLYGGVVSPSKTREYGKAELEIITTDPFLKDIKDNNQVWMSHSDTITQLPKNAKRLAGTNNIENAAFKFEEEHTYGVQFHPEVSHTEGGKQLLKNFLVDIAGLRQDWTPDSFIESSTAQLKQTLGNDQVVLGLSGGVDSSVAALLLKKPSVTGYIAFLSIMDFSEKMNMTKS
jgi:GMP synthase (glutamine-hydrolysing)